MILMEFLLVFLLCKDLISVILIHLFCTWGCHFRSQIWDWLQNVSAGYWSPSCLVVLYSVTGATEISVNLHWHLLRWNNSLCKTGERRAKPTPAPFQPGRKRMLGYWRKWMEVADNLGKRQKLRVQRVWLKWIESTGGEGIAASCAACLLSVGSFNFAAC